MPKYIIERELPGAGELGDDQIQGISQKSCQVLNDLGPQIQWVIKSIASTSPPTRR